MDRTHRYDLTFVAPRRRPRTAPQIVFSIDERHLPEVKERLFVLSQRFDDAAREYFGPYDTYFTLPVSDLFGNTEFGYGACGYVTCEGGKAHLRLELGEGARKHYCSFTLSLLAKAFALPFQLNLSDDNQQDVEPTIMAEHLTTGYGHAVGGHLSERVLSWLRDCVNEKVEGCDLFDGAHLHPSVISAMRYAWYAVNSSSARCWASEVRGMVRENG